MRIFGRRRSGKQQGRQRRAHDHHHDHVDEWSLTPAKGEDVSQHVREFSIKCAAVCARQMLWAPHESCCSTYTSTLPLCTTAGRCISFAVSVRLALRFFSALGTRKPALQVSGRAFSTTHKYAARDTIVTIHNSSRDNILHPIAPIPRRLT